MYKRVIIDCTVEKPCQIDPEEFSHKKNFFCGYEYYRSALKDCLACGKCHALCESKAINSEFEIDPGLCTACGKCYQVCPNQAIERIEKLAGYCFFSETTEAIYVSGELEPGAKCSKELLAFVKKEGQKIAQAQGLEPTLINNKTEEKIRS